MCDWKQRMNNQMVLGSLKVRWKDVHHIKCGGVTCWQSKDFVMWRHHTSYHMVDLSLKGNRTISQLAKGIFNQVEGGRVLTCGEIGSDPMHMMPTTLSMKELFEQKVVVPNVMAPNKLVGHCLTLKEIMLALDVPNTLQSVMGQISREEVLTWLRNCVPAKLLCKVGDMINQMGAAHKRKITEADASKCKQIKLEYVKLNTVAVNKESCEILYDSYSEITAT